MPSFKQSYGPWACIVGASDAAGLGGSIAVEAAAKGLNVVLIARREAMLNKLAEHIRNEHGVDTRVVVADLATPECGDVILKATEDLDVGLFIYNAAAEPQGVYTEIELSDHLRNIVVNCTSPTVLTYHFAQRMIKAGRGAIVVVGSTAGEQGICRFVSYGAAKSYEIILGEGLWYELKDYNVEAFSYVVGATLTPVLVERMKDYMKEDGTSSLQAGDNQVGINLNKPKTPAEVAKRLFESFGKGPRCYSHESDEEKARMNGLKTREQVVCEMSDMTKQAFTTRVGD